MRKLIFLLLALPLFVCGQSAQRHLNAIVISALDTDFKVALPAFSLVYVESNNTLYQVNGYFTTAQDMNDVIAAGSATALGAGGFSDPMTTRGDIIYRDATNTTARLPIGASTYVLTSDGTDVGWAAPSGGDTSNFDVVGSRITPKAGITRITTDTLAIGQTSASYPLDVNGQAAFGDASAYIQYIRIRNSSGTASWGVYGPNVLFVGIGSYPYFAYQSTNWGPAIYGRYGLTNPQFIPDISKPTTGYGGYGDVLTVHIAGTRKLTIDATGLGIGTTSPSEMLHVDGNITLNDNGDTLKVYRVIREENGINFLKPPHAFGWFADSSVTIALTQNVWAHISNASDSLFRVSEEINMTIADDTIYAPDVAAHYEIMSTFSFSGSTGNDHAIRIMTNGGEISRINFSFAAAATYQPIAINSYWNAGASGNKLWFEVVNTTDGDDITAISGNVVIKYVHAIY